MGWTDRCKLAVMTSCSLGLSLLYQGTSPDDLVQFSHPSPTYTGPYIQPYPIGLIGPIWMPSYSEQKFPEPVVETPPKLPQWVGSLKLVIKLTN